MILNSQRLPFPLTIYKLVKIFEVKSVVLSQNQNLSQTELENAFVNISILHEAYEASVRHYNFKVYFKQQQQDREKINSVLSTDKYQWKILYFLKNDPSFLIIFKRHRKDIGDKKSTVYETISWKEAYNICSSVGGSLPFTRSMVEVKMLVALVQHIAFNLRMPIFLGRQPQVIKHSGVIYLYELFHYNKL